MAEGVSGGNSYRFMRNLEQPSKSKVDKYFVMEQVCGPISQLRGSVEKLWSNNAKPELQDAAGVLSDLNEKVRAITLHDLSQPNRLDDQDNRNSVGNIGEEESVNTPTL